jgi:uncharacterized protein (TIGR02678 family)
MVDDSGDLTDLRLPEEGTDGHIGLLLATWLAQCARNNRDAAVPFSAIEQHIRDLIRIHGSKWRKAVSEAGAESRLAEAALQRLRGLRLIRITADGVIPLPAVGRYAVSDASG